MLGTSTTGESNSLVSSNDGGHLATVYEVTPHTRSRDSKFREATSIISLPLETPRPRSGQSRDGRTSPDNGIDPMSGEKLPIHTGRSLKHKSQTIGARERSAWSKELTTLGDETYRDSMADDRFTSLARQRPKSRGFRTMIRRLFGRKLTKNRISMPAPATYPTNVSFPPFLSVSGELKKMKDPNTFITSAADLMTQRSTSAPDPQVSHASALGSHAPLILANPLDMSKGKKTKPPRPDRSPPMLPAKPRRASLPGTMVNVEEADAVIFARAGLGAQERGDDGVDGANIGYAVTSGSNPKRRSRSAGTVRDPAKEHRMSPIQWRQWRRRSDEIRYWRESAGEVSPALDPAMFTGSQLVPISPTLSQGEDASKNRLSSSDDYHAADDQPGNFNFGLPADAIPTPEHIGLEERMVTLEIKLMDFEYAISKMQAALLSPRSPGPLECDAENPPVAEGPDVQSPPPIPPYHPSRPSQDSTATSSSQSAPTTPALPNPPDPLRTPQSRSIGTVDPRPTSVATTLKARSAHRASRSSRVDLTMEHYTALITLIRREQSARLRLEDQVSLLQQQLRLLNPPPIATFRDFSGRHAESPEVGNASSEARRYRGRQGSYADTTTDTDDASFHEVYVTPVERGEFERDHLPVEEEGVAF